MPDPALRPAMAHELRALRTRDRQKDPARQQALRHRFADVVNLPDPRPRTTSWEHWSPPLNPHAALPVALSIGYVAGRIAVDDIVGLMSATRLPQEMANYIFNYATASCLAETFRTVKEPALAAWKAAPADKFHHNVVENIVKDERIWAIQKFQKARRADLAMGANQATSEADEYVHRTMNNTLSFYALLMTKSLSVASFGPVGAFAVIAGASLSFVSDRFLQATLRENELKSEAELNRVRDTMYDHLQINDTSSWNLWKQSSRRATDAAHHARFYDAAAKSGPEILVSLIITASMVASHWRRSQADAANGISPTFDSLKRSAKDARKLNAMGYRLTPITKSARSYQSHARWLPKLDDNFRGLPSEGWKERATKMLDRIEDINITTNHNIPGQNNIFRVTDLLDHTEDYLGDGYHGRFTITGANGVGKTTFLNVLAAKLKEEKHYISVDSILEFLSGGGSAGEKTLNQLAETVEHITDKPVSLLGEWPVNLSFENTQRVDRLLDRLDQHVCVVEIAYFHET